MANEILETVEFEGGGRFQVVRGDLLKEETDGIVNAANNSLAHGGGVAAAIARAAGPDLVNESKRVVTSSGPVPTGAAVVTTAGDLPFKGVIHAVGPRMGEGDEEGRLVSALKASFALAHERGWRSLSFPGVSSGIFAVPHDICARAYFAAVESFWRERPDSPLSVLRLVLFEGPLLEETLQRIRGGAQRKG